MKCLSKIPVNAIGNPTFKKVADFGTKADILFRKMKRKLLFFIIARDMTTLTSCAKMVANAAPATFILKNGYKD